MKIFTVFLGEMNEYYKGKLNALRSIYPTLEVISSYPVACEPYAKIDIRCFSDLIRIYELSLVDSGMYIDLDVNLKREIKFDSDGPVFPNLGGAPDTWLIYHNGKKCFFENLYSTIIATRPERVNNFIIHKILSDEAIKNNIVLQRFEDVKHEYHTTIEGIKK